MNRISIKLRVTLWYTVILAVISAVTIFAAMTVSQQIFMRDSSERVIHTVNDFSRMMNKPQGGTFGRCRDFGSLKKAFMSLFITKREK